MSAEKDSLGNFSFTAAAPAAAKAKTGTSTSKNRDVDVLGYGLTLSTPQSKPLSQNLQPRPPLFASLGLPDYSHHDDYKQDLGSPSKSKPPFQPPPLL